MKFLKGLLIAVLVLLAIVVVLGIMMPKSYKVERSAVIDACPGLVYDEFANFKNWNSWSPWSEKDSTIQGSYSGEDGKVGSVYSWTGNPEISGQGTMEMTEMSANEVKYKLQFKVPMESESEGYFRMEETEGGVKVFWGDEGDIPFPMNVVAGLFFDFDQMIGADFERGLENLQAKLDGNNGFEPEFRESPEIHYLGKSYAMNVSELSSSVYAEAYSSIAVALITQKLAFAGSPMCLVSEFDDATGDMKMILAIPTTTLAPEIGGFVTGTIPAGKDAFTTHYGAYKDIDQTWNKMVLYEECAKPELRSYPYEQYVTDPGTEPDTSKWETYVVYPLVPEGN